MKTSMQVVMWATMITALMLTLPMAWLGYGLHPVLSAIGVLVCLGLGWASAWVIDTAKDI